MNSITHFKIVVEDWYLGSSNWLILGCQRTNQQLPKIPNHKPKGDKYQLSQWRVWESAREMVWLRKRELLLEADSRLLHGDGGRFVGFRRWLGLR